VQTGYPEFIFTSALMQFPCNKSVWLLAIFLDVRRTSESGFVRQHSIMLTVIVYINITRLPQPTCIPSPGYNTSTHKVLT
jgi:hypothetical protein